jgi:VWFA-related protein
MLQKAAGLWRSARAPRILKISAMLLLILAPAKILVQAAAQQAPAAATTAQAEPKIRSNSRLVLFDVVVTDRAGNPVTGLSKEDFEVSEDGEVQQIASFETPAMHLTPEPAAQPTAHGAGKSSKEARAAASATLPETIIVLDEMSTDSADASFAWQMLIKFLRNKPATLPEPAALLVLTKTRLQRVSEPTQDRSLLLERARKIQLELPSHSMGGGVQASAQLMLTNLLALDEIALASADRHTRKNVIWIGSGFPILSSYDVALVDRERFLSYIRYTANWLQETRTTLYTIDPKGLPVDETDYVTDLSGPLSGQDFGSNTGELIFEGLAPATGGKIYRYRNDVDVALANAVDNGSNYYTLSYYPKNSDFDGNFRKIAVSLSQRNLTATTQQGYYAVDEGTGTTKDELDFALSRAVTSPLPFASIQFDAVGKVLLGQPPTVRCSVSVDRDTLTWNPQPNGDERTEVTLVTSEITAKSGILGYRVKEMEIVQSKKQFDESPNHRVVFTVNVPLPPKTDHLRIVLRDASTGHLGTFDVPRQGLGQQAAQAK